MDYQGDVLMCSHDWGKKAIAGNLNEDEFIDIWSGLRFSRWRKLLLAGNRRISPCDVCNVEGTRMGSEHAEAWKEYYAEK
jgi:radical SAM protein with 4Fe4S-binding SPASM domain